MRILEPSATIVFCTSIEQIEAAGRVCYRSEDRIGPGTAKKFVRAILDSHHESVLEHSMMTVEIGCDRGVSHELVRHRHTSPSQESTRYCNYAKGKFGGEISVITPNFPKWDGRHMGLWLEAMTRAERAYLDLLEMGATAQEARSVLPSSLATKLTVSANFREWRLIFRLRTAKDAHPQMREIMCPLWETARIRVPVVFDDCGVTL